MYVLPGNIHWSLHWLNGDHLLEFSVTKPWLASYWQTHIVWSFKLRHHPCIYCILPCLHLVSILFGIYPSLHLFTKNVFLSYHHQTGLFHGRSATSLFSFSVCKICLFWTDCIASKNHKTCLHSSYPSHILQVNNSKWQARSHRRYSLPG